MKRDSIFVAALIALLFVAGPFAMQAWRSSLAPLPVDAQVRPAQLVESAGITADEAALAAGVGGRLFGIAVRESAGTAAVATVIFRRGDEATDEIIVPIELNPNESRDVYCFGSDGLDIGAGVFVDVVAGTVDYTVIYR